MVDFAAIKTRVQGHCNKGTSTSTDLFTEIGLTVIDSIQWIESNYSLQYMERFVSFSLDPTDDNPRTVALPSNPKSIQFVRQILESKADGTRRYRHLNLVEPRDVSAVHLGSPKGYWLDGAAYIWFDSVVELHEDYEMSYTRYTGPLLDNSSHWLFDYAPGLIVSLTMQKISAYLREPKLMDLYKPDFDRGIVALLLANDEMEFANADLHMKYGVVG